jgi:DNA-binding MarR family transcriptional regulator
MLERLVQQGLIQRSEDPYDRRVKQIVLTDRGRQTLKGSFHTRQGWLDNLVASLSEKEKNQIMAALRIMIDKANQLKYNPEREP